MPNASSETTAFPVPLSHGSVNWLGMWTLFSKEIRRFMKVYLQTLISPMITTLLFLAVFALSVGRVAHETGGVPFLEFLSPGLIMMAMVQNAFANTSSSLTISKIQGNIVDLLMAPLSSMEQLAALAGGGVVRGMVVGVVVGLSMLPFVSLHAALPWLVLYHSFTGCLLLSVLGLIGGIWADKFDHLAAVTNFIITPLSFLSGTFYSTEHLPPVFQSIALANPFFYMIDGFRAEFTGHADGGIVTGIVVLAFSNLVLLVLAWRMLDTGYKLKS